MTNKCAAFKSLNQCSLWFVITPLTPGLWTTRTFATVVTVKKQSRKVKYRKYLLNSTPLLNILYNFLITEGFEEAQCDLSPVHKQRSEEKKRRKQRRGRRKNKESMFVSSASFHPISVQRSETVDRCAARPPNRLWATAAVSRRWPCFTSTPGLMGNV